MEPYLKKVSECDEVIFSEYKNFIGRGVFEEIERAMSENKYVRCLRKRWCGFYLVAVKEIKIVHSRDWAVYYGVVKK